MLAKAITSLQRSATTEDLSSIVSLSINVLRHLLGSQTRQHSSLDEQTQSHQCFQYIGHTNFNALSNAVTRFLSISINGYHTAKNDLGTIVYKRPTFAFSPEIGTLGFWRKIAHSSSHGETGVFHPSVTVWFVLPVKLSPKEQPEKADARLMACVRFLQHRGPARLRYSIIFAINYVSCAKGCFLRAGPHRNHKRPA